MKRKINRVGPATYTVSLPKKWVEEQKLKKGDEIEVEERGNTVVVSSSKNPVAKRAKVHVIPHKATLIRTIYHCYKNGLDELEMTFDDPICAKMTEEVINKFIGFEIIDQSDNSITIKSITEVSEKDFEKTFKRLFDITLYFARKTYENLSQAKFGLLLTAANIEKTQNKLYLFCLRSLNLFKERLKEMPTFYYLLAQRLEDIGDSYRFICEHYSKEHPNKISKETLRLIEDVNKQLNCIYDAYYNFSMEKNANNFEIHQELKTRAKQLLLSQPKEEMFLISRLSKLIVDIEDAGEPIFEINLKLQNNTMVAENNSKSNLSPPF